MKVKAEHQASGHPPDRCQFAYSSQPYLTFVDHVSIAVHVGGKERFNTVDVMLSEDDLIDMLVDLRLKKRARKKVA